MYYAELRIEPVTWFGRRGERLGFYILLFGCFFHGYSLVGVHFLLQDGASIYHHKYPLKDFILVKKVVLIIFMNILIFFWLKIFLGFKLGAQISSDD